MTLSVVKLNRDLHLGDQKGEAGTQHVSTFEPMRSKTSNCASSIVEKRIPSQ